MLFQILLSLPILVTTITTSSIADPSDGCRSPLPGGLTPGGASVNFTLNSIAGGGQRRYLLHIPERYSTNNEKPSPLVVVLHAFGQTTTSMEDITRFSDSETNKEYIAVYPEGINNVWVGDPGAPNSTVVDDRPFINDLLDALESLLCIDKTRIYTAGFSNGGGLSGLLACYPPTSKRIAAFSGVSAAYYTKESLGYALFEEEACHPGPRDKPIPFMDIHGDNDSVIAYDGDNSSFDIDQNGIPDPDTLPIPQWLGGWTKRNDCPASNATSWLQNGTVQRSAWDCCGQANVVVGHYVKGLGHGWPSTVPLEGILEEYRRGPTSWNASTVLMSWYSQWRLPTGKSGR